jgi:DivIVA domain-containing protein
MIDESFHLTPLDVRRYEFGVAFRGYDKERVDQFREQVADELERLTRVGQELDGKAKSFHEQLRAYRERDKALNEALITAQELRAEIREQAEREAQIIIREARLEAERLLDEATAKVRRSQEDVEQLERLKRTYLVQLRALAERQLAEIEATLSVGASSERPQPISTPVQPPASQPGTPAPQAREAEPVPRTSGSWMDGGEAEGE